MSGGLVLARALGEAVVVTAADGSSLRITVVELRPGVVRLSFCGPKERFRVHRQEVQDRIARGEVRPPRRL